MEAQSSVMRGPWRLINGGELYDISNDPGQTRDIAGQHPERVKQLRDYYDAWWHDISSVFNETPAIVLCPSQEPVKSFSISRKIATKLPIWLVILNHKLVLERMRKIWKEQIIFTRVKEIRRYCDTPWIAGMKIDSKSKSARINI